MGSCENTRALFHPSPIFSPCEHTQFLSSLFTFSCHEPIFVFSRTQPADSVTLHIDKIFQSLLDTLQGYTIMISTSTTTVRDSEVDYVDSNVSEWYNNSAHSYKISRWSFTEKKFQCRRSFTVKFHGEVSRWSFIVKFQGEEASWRRSFMVKFHGEEISWWSFMVKKFHGEVSWGRSFMGKKFHGEEVSWGRSFMGKKFHGEEVSWGRSFMVKFRDGFVFEILDWTFVLNRFNKSMYLYDKYTSINNMKTSMPLIGCTSVIIYYVVLVSDYFHGVLKFNESESGQIFFFTGFPCNFCFFHRA